VTAANAPNPVPEDRTVILTSGADDSSI